MKIYCLIMFGLLSVGIYAQKITEMRFTSVDQVIEQSLLNNPSLEIYRLKQERSNQELKLSRSSFLPKISGSFDGQKNINLPTTLLPGDIFGIPGETIKTQFGQKYSYNAGISINKSLLDWQSYLKTKIAKVNIGLADLNTVAFEQKLIEQTAYHYYTAIITLEYLRVGEENFAVAENLLTLTQGKFNQGLISKIPVNQALINLNTIEQNLINSEILLDRTIGQLRILLGLSLDEELILTEQVSFYFIEDASGLSLLERPELQIAELEKERARLNWKTQQAAFLPKLNFSGYFGKQQFSDDSNLSFNNYTWSDYSYVGLNISIPLFTGLSNLRTAKIARIDYEVASTNLKIEEEASTVKDQLLENNYLLSIEAVRSSYENFKLTEENSEIAFQKYKQGISSIDEYFTSFDYYLNAQSVYLSTLSNTYSYYSTILSRK